jgi:hypothetical protein
MVRIACEPFGFCCPYFADVFVWREAAQCLEASAVVVGVDEVVEVSGALAMAVVIIAFDGCFSGRS